ncbi:unnamed protein product [Fusarium langsethiae]|nr:unnamed protein product [Fusarium langsethiae]
MMPISSQSPDFRDDIVSRWIDRSTQKPIFTRYDIHNLETRTIAASELLAEGFYRSVAQAAREMKVPYYRLRSRSKGGNPRSENGGNRTLFSSAEEGAILAWAHRRVIHGHHIQLRTIQQHGNAILRATNRPIDNTTRSWARRFMRRHKDQFRARKSTTRDASRKSMQDRGRIEQWYQAYDDWVTEDGVLPENTWNFDETGFMVGYLQKGIIVWTFHEVNDVILTDSHDTVLVTVVEAISATGKVIDPFIILSGVMIPLKWVQNSLPENTVITTTPTGYTNDIVAIEWMEHFEKLTRPTDPTQKRLLLLDGCESHFTDGIFAIAQQSNIELFPFPPHLTHKLQPCDVGMFNSYKWWHQQILYREVADCTTQFNKTDFLYYLSEVRGRVFKEEVIREAWRKTGIYPFDPSIVLDQLQDPLSSLTQEVLQSSLPGFIRQGTVTSDRTLPDMTISRDTTPLRADLTWNTVKTPELRIRSIRQYQDFISLRIAASIESGIPLTPSVLHVFNKMQKSSETLAINGITATEEMHRLKEKTIQRTNLQQETLICKYGPIRVGDARIRAERDQYHRKEAQKEEQLRLLRRDARDECLYIRRWLADVRSLVRRSVARVKLFDIHIRKNTRWKGHDKWKHKHQWWAISDARIHLNSATDMSYKYALHRELLHKQINGKRTEISSPLERITIEGFMWQSPVTLPPTYDLNTINQALKFVMIDEEQRIARKDLMITYENDGIEITGAIDGEDDENEFQLIKEEIYVSQECP